MKNQYNNIENNLRKGLRVIVKDLDNNDYCELLPTKDIEGDYKRSYWSNSIEEVKRFSGSTYGKNSDDWNYFDLEIVEVYRPEEDMFKVGDKVRILDSIKKTDDWDTYKDNFPEMKGVVEKVNNDVYGKNYNVNDYVIGHEYLAPLIEINTAKQDLLSKADELIKKAQELKEEANKL